MRKTYNIFLIDDDEDDRLLITTALEEDSSLFNLSFASDGAQAMETLANLTRLPDLILLDLNMPKIGGMQVLEYLKSTTEYLHIPVTMLTTSSHRADIDMAYKLGANSYIVKPTSNEQLKEFAELVRRYWFQLVKTPSIYQV